MVFKISFLRKAKKWLQRENLNPLGAFTFGRSGKSTS
jgi:hypothetical protein